MAEKYLADVLIKRRNKITSIYLNAVNPVVALELLDSGAWGGQGMLGPEALPPQPFLDLLTEYGSPWACEERAPTRT